MHVTRQTDNRNIVTVMALAIKCHPCSNYIRKLENEINIYYIHYHKLFCMVAMLHMSLCKVCVAEKNS